MNCSVIRAGPVSPLYSKDFESELYQGKVYISAATDDAKPSRALCDPRDTSFEN